MKREELTIEIKNLIAKLIGMDPKTIDDDAKFVDDLGLDSLRALEILTELEKKFDIEIPEERMSELTTINKAIDITLSVMGEGAAL